METTETLWQHVRNLPDGHRLFKLKDRPEMLAIADDSGETPDQTDDGVLWLDRKSPLRAEKDKVCLIPLIDANGASTVTPTDVQTILLLAGEFGWAIAGIYGQTYTVNRRTPVGPPLKVRP